MSIVINGIKMPKAPDERIELAIYGDGTVIQTGESLRSPEDGKCYYTITNPEKFGSAVSIPEHGRLKDYDRIMKEYDEWFSKTESREYENMFYALRMAINGSPTIIQAEKGKT